jgi:group I intron endonuclease
MDRIAGIYMIVNKRNSKIYIGASNSVLRRFREHKSPKNLNKPNVIYKAFKKYGLSSFDFILIEWLDDYKKLPEREKFWIKKINPEYNMNLGGLGNLGREVKKEIRIILRKKGKKQWEQLSEEKKKERIKNNLKGKNSDWKMSESLKLRLSNLNKGKKQSKETIKKRSHSMKKAMKGNKNGNKKIASFKDDKIIKKYDSVKKAAEEYNIHPSRISVVLTGKRNKTVGLNWKYITNE